jgi:adenylylsulfate kinase-like enzyme
MNIRISFEDWISNPFPAINESKYIITNCPKEYKKIFDKIGLSYELKKETENMDKKISDNFEPMIINLTGQAGAGKTTIAKELLKLIPNSINIDGDELREIFDNKDYSENGRRNNINNAYNIALFLKHKGYTPIISLISPYKDLRENLKLKTDVLECYVFTDEIRGRENFHVSNYEKPTSYFLPIDTTNKEVSIVVNDIYEIFSKKLFKNIVLPKNKTNDL